MRTDNKGMTIVEILISVCIIALVLTLLFSLLIQVKSEENANAIQSDFLLNQTTFIKQIEEDIVNYGVKAVAPCELDATGVDSTTLVRGYESNFKCIRIDYAADYITDNVGFLTIFYTYKTYEYKDDALVGKDANWTIRYQRGAYKTCTSNNPKFTSWEATGGRLMKEIPDEVDLSDTPYVLYTAQANTPTQKNMNAASIVLPIVNLEGEHYDINLSFTFEGNTNFVCYKNNKLNCRCEGDDALCNETLVIEGSEDPKSVANADKLKNHLCQH